MGAPDLTHEDVDERFARLAGLITAAGPDGRPLAAGANIARLREDADRIAREQHLGRTPEERAAALGVLAGRLASAAPGAIGEELLAAMGESADPLALSADLDQDERMHLAKIGQALDDGSYPVPDKEHLHAAAVLAASKHGRWQDAQRLIRKRARELGVDVSTLPGFGGAGSLSASRDPYLEFAVHEYDIPGDSVMLTAPDGQTLGLRDMVGAMAELASQQESFGYRLAQMESQQAGAVELAGPGWDDAAGPASDPGYYPTATGGLVDDYIRRHSPGSGLGQADMLILSNSLDGTYDVARADPQREIVRLTEQAAQLGLVELAGAAEPHVMAYAGHDQAGHSRLAGVGSTDADRDIDRYADMQHAMVRTRKMPGAKARKGGKFTGPRSHQVVTEHVSPTGGKGEVAVDDPRGSTTREGGEVSAAVARLMQENPSFFAPESPHGNHGSIRPKSLATRQAEQARARQRPGMPQITR